MWRGIGPRPSQQVNTMKLTLRYAKNPGVIVKTWKEISREEATAIANAAENDESYYDLYDFNRNRECFYIDRWWKAEDLAEELGVTQDSL